jgi:hypothetical protein
MSTPFRIAAQEAGYILVRWENLAADEDGAPFTGSIENGDRCIQIAGTFGGATLTWQGTNFLPPDSGSAYTNWVTLTDPQGNNLAGINTPRIETVLEIPAASRPLIVGGDGTTNLTCVMFGRRTMR